MNTCCNNIYPDEDLRRWEVGCSVPYYTKAEIDEKLENIDISGDCISSGDVQNMIDASVEPIEGSVEALSGTVGELSAGMENKAEKSEIPSLSGYATQQWVNDKGYLTSGNLKGIKETSGGYTVSLTKTSPRADNIVFGGDVDAKLEEHNHNKILMRCLLPIKGESIIYTDEVTGRDSVNGLMATRDNYAIGRWNERDDDWASAENYFSIGNGTSESNRNNIFTILKDGRIKLSDGLCLQEWMNYIENDYATKQWVNDNYMPWSEFDYIWNSDIGINSKQPMLVSGTNIKTINGQSLIGEGNITISGGGSADLSNYYTKTETNDLLDDKLDASAYTPSDLSNYWTSAQTQSAIDDAISGITGITIDQSLDSGSTNAVANSAITQAINAKADASNVYNKSEVNNIVNNKFWCGTQAQYEALATKDPNVLYLIHE